MGGRPHGSDPDASVEIESLIAEGDIAAVHWTLSGTQEGELGDLPGAGESFSMRALAFFRFEDNVIAEKWYNPDETSMMRQLGLMD